MRSPAAPVSKDDDRRPGGARPVTAPGPTGLAPHRASAYHRPCNPRQKEDAMQAIVTHPLPGARA